MTATPPAIVHLLKVLSDIAILQQIDAAAETASRRLQSRINATQLTLHKRRCDWSNWHDDLRNESLCRDAALREGVAQKPIAGCRMTRRLYEQQHFYAITGGACRDDN